MSLPALPTIIARRIHAVSVSVAVLGISVAVLVWVLLWRPFTWTPLDNVSPQKVHALTARAGGSIKATGTKCNRGNVAVAVSGAAYLMRIKPSRYPREIFRGEGVRDSGCTTSTWSNRIPSDTEPGIYRIEGIETAHDGAREQIEPWWTEEFEVTP